ncbi:unnamed protein product [Musa acuminata subsp. malaccensis]|uniref:(wild Malaysian banana) hypothetical protein n=1 Tax=Musa acuminata subsp. malaccensis TaxID=214687 RepID=A0A8D7A8E0_MUSAM|nr:unnamed protein product [Musa acuminata subsp. malaccensis]
MRLVAAMPVVFLLLTFTFAFSFHGCFVHAGDPELYYDWNVSFAKVSPFGVEKKVIVINDRLPGPLLNVTTNNLVSVNVYNYLDEPFLLTWNGVQMRRNSWNDGVPGTNCPIPPGKNWTYHMQVKDQIGSFFYFPSLGFQMAAGGYGPIRIDNRVIIPIPFSFPQDDLDILIADWYDMDYQQDMRDAVDQGFPLSLPDGILINGLPPEKANFTFKSGATYRLRISNVGIKTTLNFRIQGHKMLLVETEGSYTLKQYYDSLDIHVGQSYSVLVTADQPPSTSYYIVASSRFVELDLFGVAIINYDDGSNKKPSGGIPEGPSPFDYNYSMEQARSIRWDLKVGAARPNPQGSYRYGHINISRTIVLQNDEVMIGDRTRYAINGVSFVYPDTPLKLADYFGIPGVFMAGEVPDEPSGRKPTIGTPVVDAIYKSFVEIIFQNNESSIQSWHLDGYNFFVVGMEEGKWNFCSRSTYNMVDAIFRSTVQVYPNSWTAILVAFDNMGMWNIRSQELERRQLGQELYMRVNWDDANNNTVPNPRDEMPFSPDLLLCGKAAARSGTP